MTAATSLGDDQADWTAVAAVVLGVTAFAVVQGLTYPLISLALTSRGAPPAVVGFNAAAFAAGLATATLSIRHLLRVLSGDRLIFAALLACSAALATFWAAEPLWVWFVARLVLGLGAGLVFILSEAWLHTASPDRLRGRVSGIYGACMCLGFAAGPMAIPLFGTTSSFGFAVTAVYVAAVAFALTALSRRARTRPQPVPAGGLGAVIIGSPLLVTLVAAFGFADIAAISGLPVYLLDRGHSEAFAAFSVSAMALPTGLAQPLVGVLLDRVPRMAVVAGAGTLAAATFLVLPLLSNEPAILLDFALMGSATFALYTCALTLLGARYTGGLLVAGTAAFSLAYAVGSAAGSSITGLAAQWSPVAGAPVVTGAVLAGLTLVVVLRRRHM